MRRRLAHAALSLVVVGPLAATAAAETIEGTARPDRLVGTRLADVLRGHGGGDRLTGLAGADLLHGGSGRDALTGGPGDDRIAVQADAARDAVSCGRGRDVVTADLADRIAADCEAVSRALSRDRSRDPESQHATQVEPDSFAFGSTIVTTFQSGRFRERGAASEIGFATSHDGGRTWRSGFLPNLTAFSTPAGSAGRVSDPVVAYDAVHGVWLIASLAVSGPLTDLYVSISPDGVAWSAPVVAARGGGPGGIGFDKEWIACDNWPTSPFRGRCYLSYTDLRSRGPARIATQFSTDGGRTWSRPVASGAGNVVGAQPVPRPNGELAIVYLNAELGPEGFEARPGQLEVVLSTDGGASFAAPVRVAPVNDRRVDGIRAPPLPSADVDAAGKLYVAWHDCARRPDCRANDIVVATSADGVTWSPPARLPLAAPGSAADHFVTGFAVDPASPPSAQRLAVAYYLSRGAGIEAAVALSTDGGASWRQQRLTAEPMRLRWLPETPGGRFLGDYISTSFVDGRPTPVFALASRPVGGRFRQAIFATQLGRGAFGAARRN